jgi:SAM-dependent methyltransferase
MAKNIKTKKFPKGNNGKKLVFRKNCRICFGKNFHKIINLGEMPPANAFLGQDELKRAEEQFPLSLYFCNDCGLVQLRHVVDPEILFKNYHYQTSASAPLVKHFREMALEIASKHIKNADELVVEIGSNDGVLLENLKQSARVLGVDPDEKMAEIANSRGVPTLTGFFNKNTAKEILKNHGQAKVIVANNVLAHIDDLHSVIDGVKILLSGNGRFIFEAHWVGNLIGNGGYDQIYHEHLCYFSLHSISRLAKKFGLKVLDVALVPIHGESLKVTIGKNGSVNKSVEMFLKKEKKLGLEKSATYEKFSKKVKTNKKELVKLLKQLKKDGKTIVGYGAPAKGNTLLNYCGIGPDILDFITDTTPIKQGLFTPGTRIPIMHPEKVHQTTPDYILLLAWNYAPEILKKETALRKKGVKFIIPVPQVRIV